MSFVQARRVAALSWPLYLAAAAVVVGAIAVLLLVPSLRWIAGLTIFITIAVATASFWAFHMMFDTSDLLKGTWLRDVAPSPSRWVEITTALEQTTLPMGALFPAATGQIIDIYDPSAMTEPALTRARDSARPVSARIETVESGSADLVVIMLAAHEIRARDGRRRLFKEVVRVVSPNGSVVLVEHLRDLVAALAFGPGVFHFFPRSEWLELGSEAGLKLTREFPITPFVRVFVYSRG